MIVTVNTDASFHPKHKVGAYAFWIVCNQGRLFGSGALRESKNPIDAELKCIANALHVLLHSQWKDVSKVIINSDCLYAFEQVGRKKPLNSPGRKVADLLRSLKEKHVAGHRFNEKFYEFRHVKAHSGTEERRKWVNDWCDKKAKEALRKQLNSIGL